MTIRWLHLSDVHESKKDGHHRRRMYEHIVNEVKANPEPDLIFLTGDLAFAGTEEEYATLERDFIAPLKAAAPKAKLFTVPGNHDADRSRQTKPRLWAADEQERALFQEVSANGARKRRDLLLPRFQAYADFEQRVSDWGTDWLGSEAGSVCEVLDNGVAIVGINTAWLAQDDEDWGRLTPGRYMLEAALDEARRADPRAIIVLGHHPLEAMFGEGQDSDGQRIRNRLEQANALYLHGHLHASDSGYTGNALRSALAIQAPSAFQAHDDKRWRNGLMWGELDVDTGTAILEPRLWSEDPPEFKWDNSGFYTADRAPGRDGFRLRLPGSAAAAATAEDRPAVPRGWQIIDRDFLTKARDQRPSTEEMVDYFNGTLPVWKLVLADGVAPRGVVTTLAGKFSAVHSGAPKPRVVLLSGAGGEGKSTAVLHAAAQLVRSDKQAWTCLHRHAAAAPMPAGILANLPERPDHAWLVVIDDADAVGGAILEAVATLGARTDVHLLLAARDADWRGRRLHVAGLWRGVDFQTVPLSGLDRADAERIVSAWAAWGDSAMGALRGRAINDAATALLGHATELAANPEDGALLGALLITRQGESMDAHVATMLEALGTEPVIGPHRLRDIYAMIAAMHAENQLYLSREVLAYFLGCDEAELEDKALSVLRREAMLDGGGTVVLTRHRRIADSACRLLREAGEAVDGWYPKLAAAARRHFLAPRATPSIADWCNALPKHFVDQGQLRWPVARAVAKALYESESDNAHLLTGYATILRTTGQAAEAMAVLKSAGERFRQHRGVLSEWGTVAGACGDYGVDAWLGARSLADGGPELTAKNAKLSLAGLGVAFRELFAATGDSAFLRAQAACGHLGLLVPELDGKTRGYFEGHRDAGARHGIGDLGVADALAAIRAAAILAADEVAPEDGLYFERLIGEPDGYRFTALERLLAAEAKGRKA